MFEKKILGMDIGSKNIKLALVTQGKKPAILKTYQVATPEDSVIEGEIRNIESVTARIKSALQESRISARELNISINSPNAVIREIKLPVLKSSEIGAAVEFELAQSFPGITQTHTICSMIYTSPNMPVEGIAAFCPNKILDPYIELAKRMGMQLKTIDLQANAVTRAYNQFTEKPFEIDTVLVVEIGYTNSQVNLISFGKLLASRNISSGLIAIDNMVANRLGISLEQAERARINKKYDIYNITNEDMANITRISLSAIEDQIRHTIDFYKYNKGGAEISGILLSGGGSLFSELCTQLKEMFNLKVAEVRVKTRNTSAVKDSSIFLPAIGVALNERDEKNRINLIPHMKELSLARSSVNKMSVIIAILAAIALLTVGTYAFFYLQTKADKSEVEALTVKIKDLSSINELKSQIKSKEDKVNSISSTLDAYNTTTLINTKLFDSIGGMMPDTIFTVSYSVVEDNAVNINGVSKGRTDIASFIYKLKQIDQIESVTVNNISTRMGEDTKPIDYSFVLEIKLKGR